MHNYVANAVNVPQQGSQSLPVSEETLKTLMDCPLTTDTFFIAGIPNETFFRLTDEWKRIEPKREQFRIKEISVHYESSVKHTTGERQW